MDERKIEGLITPLLGLKFVPWHPIFGAWECARENRLQADTRSPISSYAVPKGPISTDTLSAFFVVPYRPMKYRDLDFLVIN